MVICSLSPQWKAFTSPVEGPVSDRHDPWFQRPLSTVEINQGAHGSWLPTLLLWMPGSGFTAGRPWDLGEVTSFLWAPSCTKGPHNVVIKIERAGNWSWKLKSVGGRGCGFQVSQLRCSGPSLPQIQSPGVGQTLEMTNKRIISMISSVLIFTANAELTKFFS